MPRAIGPNSRLDAVKLQRRLWTPAQLQTALWLDAADLPTFETVSGAISQWSDKSGNARHATQAESTRRPTLSGAGVLFDGVNDYLNISTTAFQTSTQMIVYVFARKGSGGGADMYRPEISCSVTHDRGALHYIKNSNNLGASYPYYLHPSPFYDLSSGQAYANDEKTVISFFGDGTNFNVARNATLEGSCAIGGFDANCNGLQLGAQFAVPRYSNIAMFEVVALTYRNDSHRQIIEGYMAHKWGLSASLPANHPYRNRPPEL